MNYGRAAADLSSQLHTLLLVPPRTRDPALKLQRPSGVIVNNQDGHLGRSTRFIAQIGRRSIELCPEEFRSAVVDKDPWKRKKGS